jgi:hypothetical protein
MRRFAEEGEILFRPLSYYRALEGPKADAYEGTFFLGGKAVKVSMSEVGGSSWTDIDEVVSIKWGLSHEQAKLVLVSCYSRRQLNDNRHGDATVVIEDVPKFIEIIDDYMGRYQQVLSCGNVRYYDGTSASQFPTSIALSWLSKRATPEFVEEWEFRLGVNSQHGTHPLGPDGSMKLVLGNLAGIAKII